MPPLYRQEKVKGYTLSYQYSGGNDQCRGTLFLTADTDTGTNSSGISENAVALSIQGWPRVSYEKEEENKKEDDEISLFQ